ncbi:hypothetical protein BBJ28_00021818 [Nothophytophthora sp. Chile5]|nr:hypothetical protein BBJ28_00021818 [Nothophytophthora sp. Chile5]
MADGRRASAPSAGDGLVDQQLPDETVANCECTPVWDAEHVSGSDEDDAFSAQSRVDGHDDSSDDDDLDSEFEDAWLDDYLPDSPDATTSSANLTEERIESSSRCGGGPESQEDDDEGQDSASTSRRFSLALEVDTTPSLMVVDAAGDAVVSVSSPRLAGLAALRGNDSFAGSGRRLSSPTTTEPSSPAAVHPIPVSMPLNKSIRRDSSQPTPLSPSTSPYKRANSLLESSTSTTTKVLLSQHLNQDTSSPMLPRPRSQSQVWDSSETTKKRSSRLLDEWKRKELWQDLKRAEENVVTPNGGSKTDNSCGSSRLRKYKRAASDARLDTLLQTLQAEVATPSHSKDVVGKPEARRPPLQRRKSAAHVASAPLSPVEASDEDDKAPQKRPWASATPSSDRSGPSPVAAASVAPIPPSVPSVPLSEFEQVQQEKLTLHAELDSARGAAVIDQETICGLNDTLQQVNGKLTQLSEKQMQLETVERDNRFLKEETQKHVMQALSSTELIKTLGDQLALTSKSEEQLKLQTKQLMEQNQSLQSDLLEKIAAETAKFQKMARLSSENESLMEELERKENAASERDSEERLRSRARVLHRLLRLRRREMLQSATSKWSQTTREVSTARSRALSLFSSMDRGLVLKLKAAAFGQLRIFALLNHHTAATTELQRHVDGAKQEVKKNRVLNGVLCMDRMVDRWERRQAAKALCIWTRLGRQQSALSRSLTLGASKLRFVLQAQKKTAVRGAFSKWQFAVQHEGGRGNLERAQRLESSLAEAKDCVFSLSRAKTRLEEKLQTARDGIQRLTGELGESAAELQLVKHGFVTTVIRDVERSWLRNLLVQWRVQTHVSIITKQLRLQVEMAELKAAERDKYSKSMDDYSRVLRGDLERYQFFSQDKRIALDVLSKKLLREEERYRHMEERHVALEEKAHALKNQLATFVEWDGLALPFSVLALCKDVAVSNLRELFLLHAAADNAALSGGEEDSQEAPTPRLALTSLVRILGYSTLLTEEVVTREALPERLARHLPAYAVERGLLFPDFITGLNQFLTEVFPASGSKHDQLKRFWASLLSLLGSSQTRGGGASSGIVSGNGRDVGSAGNGDNGLILCPSRGSWAGRLSDDILQNQEKLLAVLEHETAVVERAVKEKASLKHTYQATEHAPNACDPRDGSGSGSSTTFFEYQCDPLFPPEPTNGAAYVPVAVSTSMKTINQSNSETKTASTTTLETYANWYLAPQVRDLFLAFHRPLLKLLVQYSGGQRNATLDNQYCLPLTAVVRMLADLKLHPTFLSRDVVQTLFGHFREGLDVDGGLLTPQGFTLFLGSCALDLYARSLADSGRAPEFLLSAREVLLSFFGDLGFLAESNVPPASRLCFVGTEVENILWPLFEYYASVVVGDAGGNSSAPNVAEDTRIGMTAATFERFMTDIAGKGADDSHAIFHRVLQETRDHRSRLPGQPRAINTSTLEVTEDEQHWRMHLDEFYTAISYIQTARSPGTTYTTPGDAVRRWLQQTQ